MTKRAETSLLTDQVYETIRRLEEAGLAERVPHKGAVVKGLTLAELVHVYDVRRLLEVEAHDWAPSRSAPPTSTGCRPSTNSCGPPSPNGGWWRFSITTRHC
ncbi:hypothetical protein JOJ86_007178 [Rhodococcus percolatus]|uniref:Uncharacterized protein n=1 Tax=Rhodococcus opacus TaxID=37919 RepID=A0A1B1KDW0_RHOOP|nr:hypothetical protein R1CP_30835 [Rhodococcus opacus]MBA8962019.1 hypothetical protein [Rhodococcus opacus]MBP2209452.1 hypothetical protein [Rhodococcus opacus]CAG7585423.1 hypothetical protein E143388_02020 [Rhodococcus opacus]